MDKYWNVHVDARFMSADGEYVMLLVQGDDVDEVLEHLGERARLIRNNPIDVLRAKKERHPNRVSGPRSCIGYCHADGHTRETASYDSPCVAWCYGCTLEKKDEAEG